MDENSTNEERISLLRKTCSEHAVMYKDAMNGKGIDRHMFGLYVVSKGLGYVSTLALHTCKVLGNQRLQIINKYHLTFKHQFHYHKYGH